MVNCLLIVFGYSQIYTTLVFVFMEYIKKLNVCERVSEIKEIVTV